MPFNPKIPLQAARQNVKRHLEYPGVLGSGSGNPYAGRSKYWVRFPIGTDENGYTVYTPARPVRYAGESAIIAREGIEVLVHVDPYDGVETIPRIIPDYPGRADFDSRIMNTSDPITQWTDARKLIRLLARASGGETAQVTIQANPFHVDDFGERSTYSGTLPDDQLDLTGIIPAVGYHALAVVFFDLLNNEPLVKVSTTQALETALDSTDYDECFTQLPHHEFIPLKSFDIGNGQTAISMLDEVEDLRTWLPTPRIYGFPTPVPEGKSILIRSTHTVTHAGNLEVLGNLIVEGNLFVL